ncbi:MAG: YmaF family protein [Bacillota bacterium]
MEDRREFPHVHDYFGRTSVDDGHFHTFTGATMEQVPAVGGHVHNYANETRVAENHTHIMRGTSGLPIPVLLGHVHQLAGVTEIADNHSHSYDVYTGYQRPQRNVRRPRFTADAVAENKEEAPQGRRPRFRFPRRESSPTSDEK